MTAKNAEGYPDPTAEEAIRHVMRGGKLDYTSFRTYEELQDYTIEHNKGISTREAADKFIREKIPKESYFQKKILDWIKDNAPNAIAWKEAAGPYSRGNPRHYLHHQWQVLRIRGQAAIYWGAE